MTEFLSSIQRAGRAGVNRLRGLALLPLLIIMGLLAGCSGPMSILDPAGPAARDQFWVWWAMLIVSVIVAIVVFALWLYTFRRKNRPEYTPQQERRIMLRWVLGGGVLLPGVSIVLLLVFGAPTGRSMLPLERPDGQTPEVIDVIGHQWWWEVRYPDEEQGEVITANQLVMPAGEPVDFRIASEDVIHAFWIPRLGGKRDMVPGRTSIIRLEADAPGVFSGQCAEFCGAQHRGMLLHVEALERDDYEAWLEARRSPPEQLPEHDEAREAFGEHCASCHRIAGLPREVVAGGADYEDIQAPDLSDIGSRPTLGAGQLLMEEGAIAYWLQHHQLIKPGNRMPPHNHLDTETLESIGAWLETMHP